MERHLQQDCSILSDLVFRRTHDKKFVHACITNPAVWRMSADETTSKINPALFFIPKDLPFYYLKVDPGYGLLIGEPKGIDVYEVHVALFPEAKGMAVEICTQAIKWFFDNEPSCNVLTASIPSFNHLSKRLAKMVGMDTVGTRHGAFLKDGRAYDLHLFEIRR